jgi:hypothetical protein
MMYQRESSPDARDMLPQAIEKVSDLYQGEILDEALGFPNPSARDARWREAAVSFRPFKNKIIGLRLALNNARQSYKSKGEALQQAMEERFDSAGDLRVGHLLQTLLCSRATVSQGVIDPEIVLNTEAAAMGKELGVTRGVQGLDLETMGFDFVVEALLTGRLRLSRQTQKDI